MTNQTKISGVLLNKQPIRYTPAGIPLVSFVLQHQSQQTEAGMRRQVMCEVQIMALAEMALVADQLQVGSPIQVTGFLAKRSMKSTQLVLHVINIEY